MFCYADDWMRAGLLESAATAADREKADIVVFGVRNISSAAGGFYGVWKPPKREGVFTVSSFGDKAFVAFKWCAWNKLFRRKMVLELGIRFQNLPRVNDLFFVVANLATADRIITLDAAGYCYHIDRNDNLCSTRDQHTGMAIEAWRELRRFLEERHLFELYRAALVRGLLISISNEMSFLHSSEMLTDFQRYATKCLGEEFGIDDEFMKIYDSDPALQEIYRAIINPSGPLKHCVLRVEKERKRCLVTSVALMSLRRRYTVAKLRNEELSRRADELAGMVRALKKRPDSIRTCVRYIFHRLLQLVVRRKVC